MSRKSKMMKQGIDFWLHPKYKYLRWRQMSGKTEERFFLFSYVFLDEKSWQETAWVILFFHWRKKKGNTQVSLLHYSSSSVTLWSSLNSLLIFLPCYANPILKPQVDVIEKWKGRTLLEERRVKNVHIVSLTSNILWTCDSCTKGNLLIFGWKEW